MHSTLEFLAAIATCTLSTTIVSGQSAKDIRGPSPLLAIENEPPPKLIVDPPLPSVDDAVWHFVDASGETIILVGLEPGPHKVLIELADPTHKIITSKTVNFSVPDAKTPKSENR